MKKILIFGAGGQLGRELSSIYPDAVRAYHNGSGNEINVDLARKGMAESLIMREAPDLVINAAALANVDLCERDHQLAFDVNGESVLSMVRGCRTVGSSFIHVSTDYVFDGTVGYYSESSIPNPINYYGLSKLIGDAYALSYENAIVVRTSGVFGHLKNYPLYVLETLKNSKPVNAIRGYYSPIHARNLALSISELVKTDYKGLLNIAGERVSRYDLAMKIADAFSLDTSLISEVGDLKSLNAKRPFDSSLEIRLAHEMISFDFSSVESNLSAMKATLAKGD